MVEGSGTGAEGAMGTTRPFTNSRPPLKPGPLLGEDDAGEQMLLMMLLSSVTAPFLSIWWNLNILRGTLKGGGQPNLIHLSPAGLSRAYAFSLLRCSGGGRGSQRPHLFPRCAIGFLKGS
jgi:hypothetical protein